MGVIEQIWWYILHCCSTENTPFVSCKAAVTLSCFFYFLLIFIIWSPLSEIKDFFSNYWGYCFIFENKMDRAKTCQGQLNKRLDHVLTYWKLIHVLLFIVPGMVSVLNPQQTNQTTTSGFIRWGRPNSPNGNMKAYRVVLNGRPNIIQCRLYFLCTGMCNAVSRT